MACVSPPELEDRDLLAFIDGEGEKRVAEHLDKCAYCRERAAVFARLQGNLTRHLYRIECPSPDELGEYHLRLLPDARATAVAEHLSGCPQCRLEMTQLQSFLQTVETTGKPSSLEQVGESIRILIAQLVNELSDMNFMGQSDLTPAYAGIRGAEKAPRVYQADALQIVIDTQEDPDKPERHMILGLILGLEPPVESSAHLWQENQPLAEAPVDDLGNFIFSGLVQGVYELIISSPHLEIHIQDLVI